MILPKRSSTLRHIEVVVKPSYAVNKTQRKGEIKNDNNHNNNMSSNQKCAQKTD